MVLFGFLGHVHVIVSVVWEYFRSETDLVWGRLFHVQHQIAVGFRGRIAVSLLYKLCIFRKHLLGQMSNLCPVSGIFKTHNAPLWQQIFADIIS